MHKHFFHTGSCTPNRLVPKYSIDDVRKRKVAMAPYYRVLVVVVVAALCTGSVTAHPKLTGMWPPARSESTERRQVPGAANVINKALAETVDGMGISFADVIDHTCNKIYYKSACMVVGGFVRDAFQNIESKDVDVGILPARGSWSTSYVVTHLQSFVGRVAGRYVSNSGIICKVGAPLPGQASYITPLELVDGSISIGANNYDRDFTVNAVYYDFNAENFYDPTRKGVDDTLSRTLRVACHGMRYCEDKWWTGLGDMKYRKMQRYFHMRMKGYKAERDTLRMVMGKLTEALNDFDDDEALKVLDEFMYGLDKQTLNAELSVESWKYKLSLFLEVMAEDYREFKSISHWNASTREAFWKQTLAPFFVESKRSSDGIHLYVRARGGILRDSVYVYVDGVRVYLPANNNVSQRQKPDWQKMRCRNPRHCQQNMSLSSSGIDGAIQLISEYEYGILRNVGTITPPVSKSTSNCKKMVELSLYQASRYEGLTTKHLYAKGMLNMENFLTFKENIQKFEHEILPAIQEYPGVEYILKKFLVDYVRRISAGVRPGDLMTGLSSVVDIPGAFDWSSATDLVDVINNGNARERSFMIWNLVTRCPSQWYSRFFSTLSDQIDPCDGAVSLPLPAGWVYVNYNCKEEYGCQSPRESYSGTKFYFKYSDTLIPALSDRETRYLQRKNARYIDWNIGKNIYSVSSGMLPNPLKGSHAMQGGFRYQTESNGFETLAGASGSGAWILQFAKQYLEFSEKDLCLMRLALASTMPPTMGHSLYEVLMAAEPYMMESQEVKLDIMDPDTYLSFGKKGLLPKRSSGILLTPHSVSTRSSSQFRVYNDDTYADPYTQSHLNKWLKQRGLVARGFSAEEVTVFGQAFEDADAAADYVGRVLKDARHKGRLNLQRTYEAYEARHARSGAFIYREVMQIAALVRPMFEAGGRHGSTELELGIWKKVADLARATYTFAMDKDETGKWKNPSSHRPAKAAGAMKAAASLSEAIIQAEADLLSGLLTRCVEALNDLDSGENNDIICREIAYAGTGLVKEYRQEICGKNGLVSSLQDAISKEVITNSVKEGYLPEHCMHCLAAVNVFQTRYFMTKDTGEPDWDTLNAKYCGDYYWKIFTTEKVYDDPTKTWSGYFHQAPYIIPGYGSFQYHIYHKTKEAEATCRSVAKNFLSYYSHQDRIQLIEDVTQSPAEGENAYAWTHKPFEICTKLSHCKASDAFVRPVLF